LSGVGHKGEFDWEPFYGAMPNRNPPFVRSHRCMTVYEESEWRGIAWLYSEQNQSQDEESAAKVTDAHHAAGP
jgi:hypothetical protein